MLDVARDSRESVNAGRILKLSAKFDLRCRICSYLDNVLFQRIEMGKSARKHDQAEISPFNKGLKSWIGLLVVCVDVAMAPLRPWIQLKNISI